MTTPRFSVPYRAPHVVDLLIPKIASTDGYRIKASPQFDGSPAFVTLFTVPIGAGFVDPAVDRRKLHTMPGTNRVRAVFDPDTYTGSAAILDSAQFWLVFQPVVGGVGGADSDPVLVLTPSQFNGAERIIIQGSAPNGANLAASLSICLGRRMTGFTFKNNDGTNSLFVAFNRNAQEIEVPGGTTISRHSLFGNGSTSTLLVRGGGGAVSFSADFTAAQNVF
jgi:hypothetical protein